MMDKIQELYKKIKGFAFVPPSEDEDEVEIAYMKHITDCSYLLSLNNELHDIEDGKITGDEAEKRLKEIEEAIYEVVGE